MTSTNDKLRLFEVPFRFALTGTALVLAADEAKALDKLKEQFTDDNDVMEDEAFYAITPDVTPVLVDGDPKARLDFDKPTPSSIDIYAQGLDEGFDDDELALYDHTETSDESVAKDDTSNTSTAAPSTSTSASPAEGSGAPAPGPAFPSTSKPSVVPKPNPNPAGMGMQRGAPTSPPRPSPATPNPNFPTGTVPGKK